MRNGDGGAAKVRLPKERSGRRTGWTEGPSVRLAGGEAWHLPRVDAALIPVLPEVVAAAEAVARGFGAAPGGRTRPVGFEGDLVDLVVRLLRSQYRGGERTLAALVTAADLASLVAMLDVLDHYLADLLTFAAAYGPDRGGPAGAPSAN